MREAATAARDSGVSLFYLGSNADYWKMRFEASPVSGIANRVEVCYKTSESGPSDPTGIPTTTWRDPTVNEPENSLIGEMYAGDSASAKLNIPLQVTFKEARNHVWRGAGFAHLHSGGVAHLGQALVGWEWDAPAANGAQPAGLVVFAHTPVPAGPGQTIDATATEYRAPSGAIVVDTGTNEWSRGLGFDQGHLGEPNAAIERVTVNILADMHALPAGSARTRRHP